MPKDRTSSRSGRERDGDGKKSKGGERDGDGGSKSRRASRGERDSKPSSRSKGEESSKSRRSRREEGGDDAPTAAAAATAAPVSARAGSPSSAHELASARSHLPAAAATQAPPRPPALVVEPSPVTASGAGTAPTSLHPAQPTPTPAAAPFMVLGSDGPNRHACYPLADAFRWRLSRLQDQFVGPLSRKRERLLLQTQQVQLRMEEVKQTRSAIERETMRDAEGMLARLRSDESLRLSLLQHDLAALQGDVQLIERFQTHLLSSRPATALHAVTGRLAAAQTPPEPAGSGDGAWGPSVQDMADFMNVHDELCTVADSLVAKPFKQAVDVTADLPREAATRNEMARRYEAAVRLLRLKDEMIWALLRERETWQARHASSVQEAAELSADASRELTRWAELTDQMADAIRELQLQARGQQYVDGGDEGHARVEWVPDPADATAGTMPAGARAVPGAMAWSRDAGEERRGEGMAAEQQQQFQQHPPLQSQEPARPPQPHIMLPPARAERAAAWRPQAPDALGPPPLAAHHPAPSDLDQGGWHAGGASGQGAPSDAEAGGTLRMPPPPPPSPFSGSEHTRLARGAPVPLPATMRSAETYMPPHSAVGAAPFVVSFAAGSAGVDPRARGAGAGGTHLDLSAQPRPRPAWQGRGHAWQGAGDQAYVRR